ncbi:sensor histidine kinase [Corynebacterium sp. CCM 9185]|uniref:Sensor histidine kinase n=2 Tax=Corynebacterium marambiense TaxID=2765364 RepID=A0ABS0VWL5_9CORY|nr:sensor histidine kinase [Corynebacterium marambiense]MCK7663724.1 sensor histidine kinase [Corynebacterium marambiense]
MSGDFGGGTATASGPVVGAAPAGAGSSGPVPQPVRMMSGSRLDRASKVRRMGLSVGTEAADRTSSAPGEKSIRQGIHILTGALLVVVAFAAVKSEALQLLITLALCAAFSGIYILGSRFRDTMSGGINQIWLLALTLLWVLLIPMQPTAIYLVFPLYFLYLQVLDDVRGVIAVIGATAVSVFSQWPHLTAGAILGPTVAALVSIGIDYAFKTLWKVSAEREELIAELLETRSQLADTERAAGIAAERQRIAHEIHDTLAQGLSSIQMLLYVAEQELKKTGIGDDEAETILKRIDQARTTAADNLGEARAMIAALQPAALSRTSLEGALHRVANGIVGTEVTIAVEGDERQLPMRTEASLLRIAQGAMGNVAKHAAAGRCHVTLTYGEDEVRLDVVDDGCGFDPEAIGERPRGLGHIGLDAMRQRAAEQHGTLTVESAPGQGTAVSIAIPVEDDTGVPARRAMALTQVDDPGDKPEENSQ